MAKFLLLFSFNFKELVLDSEIEPKTYQTKVLWTQIKMSICQPVRMEECFVLTKKLKQILYSTWNLSLKGIIMGLPNCYMGMILGVKEIYLYKYINKLFAQFELGSVGLQYHYKV